MKRYQGYRHACGYAVVTVDSKMLDPRLDVRDHSPTGLEWGYAGSGPAQLALAILCDHCGEQKAQRLYQQFKWDVVASFAHLGWSLTSDQIDDLLPAETGGDEEVDRD